MVTVTETTVGSTARYSCSGSNYDLVGAAERTCQADGMWSGSAPECGKLLAVYLSLHPSFCHLVAFTYAVIDCGSLQNPENGLVTLTETTVGSTASYSCSGSNYDLVGAAERTCQADGMWSGSAPECGKLLAVYIHFTDFIILGHFYIVTLRIVCFSVVIVVKLVVCVVSVCMYVCVCVCRGGRGGENLLHCMW